MSLHVDGTLVLTTENVDSSMKASAGWAPYASSVYGPAFGNESQDEPQWPDQAYQDIAPEVTGYSIWRRVAQMLDDPATGREVISWSGDEGFPDQYQLDHMVRIEASVQGGDQGYSGWTQLPDGSIIVLNYTDDTAPSNARSGGGAMGISWIRGTFLELSDLPPIDQRPED